MRGMKQVEKNIFKKKNLKKKKKNWNYFIVFT